MSPANTACPVCGHKNIEKGSSECPQCNADLKCFNILDSIPDRETAPSPIQADFAHIPGFRALLPGIVFSVIGVLMIMTLFLFYKIMRLEESLGEKSNALSCEIRELSSRIADMRRDDIILRKDLEIRIIELKSELKESLIGISGELKQAANLAVSENARFYQSLNSVSEKLNKEENRLNGIERQSGQVLDLLDKQGDRVDKQSERLLEMDKHYKEAYDSENRRDETFLKTLKELSARIENLTGQIEKMTYYE
jgi:hypothetical protein